MTTTVFDLTVSIVLHQTPIEELRLCLDSLSDFKGNIYLYIVDNSPTDALKAQCPSNLCHEYIHLSTNPGYGSAHNVAIRKARLLVCPYHLVLNADIKFGRNVLTPMLSYMDQHVSVGLMMPKVLNSDGTVQYLCKLLPSPSDLLWRRFSSREVNTSRKKRFELHMSGYSKTMFVPNLSGCFMLLRQSTLSDIGLFDERYFMYGEDIDLCRRIASSYETIFFPEVSVTHAYGAASYKSIKMLLIHALNIARYFNKWGWIFDSGRTKLNQKTLNQLSNSP
jgi:GT2 family glycosyltransferase